MGVVGSAKLLQALARDHLVPGLSIFGQGTSKADEPIYAICVTFLIALVTMFANINQIASFITVRNSYKCKVHEMNTDETTDGCKLSCLSIHRW
jgi:amino acid transporter